MIHNIVFVYTCLWSNLELWGSHRCPTGPTTSSCSTDLGVRRIPRGCLGGWDGICCGCRHRSKGFSKAQDIFVEIFWNGCYVCLFFINHGFQTFVARFFCCAVLIFSSNSEFETKKEKFGRKGWKLDRGGHAAKMKSFSLFFSARFCWKINLLQRKRQWRNFKMARERCLE